MSGTLTWKPHKGAQERFHNCPAFELLYGGAAGGGKALVLSTPILKANGIWTTMGDIEARDWIFDEAGYPCEVMAVSDVMFNRRVFKVIFDDGSIIKADAEHLWLTSTVASRQSRARKLKRKLAKNPNLARPQNRVLDSIVSTSEIKETLRTIRQGQRANHAIRMARELYFNPIGLPIEPYVLGAWLGDGSSYGGGFSCADEEILQEIQKEGHKITKWSGKYAYGISDLYKPLRENNLLGNKHIPPKYFRASITQRYDLLFGLMDTDGTALPSGACEFYSTNIRLISDVWELLQTLGIKCNIRTGRAMLYGKDCGTKYRIKFTTAIPMFRLKRKRNKQVKSTTERQSQRYIVDIIPCESEPVKCIKVNSPSHLYLVGKTMIATHNSDSLIMEASKYVQYGDYKALLMRRKFTELSKADGLMDRAHKWYPALGGKWSGERRRWTFPSEAVIEFGHMEYESNKHDYQSAAYSFIGFDELTSFTEAMYLYMISRCRNVNPKIPKTIRAATNPGNVGHVFCKKRFIKEPYTIYEDKDGMTKCFIPATAYDNPTLMKNDPDYVKRLELLPDKEKRMLLYGDWDVFEGMYFEQWDEKIHVCKPFELDRAYRFMGLDYGYSSPSSVGWFAVTESGMTYLERELYIEKLTYSELAKMILDMTPKNEQIFYCVADPKIWGDRPHHKDSMVGESGGEVMAKIFGNRITLIKGDNNRITGWGRCREYLKPYEVNGEVTARFKVFNTCPNFIRTVPQMIHNETGNVEDMDTTGEDHLADMWRYGMMSRPGVPDMVKESRILTRDERLWKLARETLKRQKKGNDMIYIGNN